MNHPVPISAPIRVCLVDDQRLMRDGLRTLLELEEDLEVVGEADEGQAALQLYEAVQPDVVLMDVRMPGMDGVEATRRMLARWPDARVIILTTFDDDEQENERNNEPGGKGERHQSQTKGAACDNDPSAEAPDRFA